ncbi:unnamed protein product [[Candida] boidinii]|nr:unnamed protein product [[Candida] boidinii]
MSSSEDKSKAHEAFEIDDGATAVDGDQPEKDKQQQEQQAQVQQNNTTAPAALPLASPLPSQVNYVRGSGFDRDAYDGTTLVEGEAGSSSAHAK